MILTLKGHSEVMQPWVSWGCGGVPLSQSAHSGQSTRSCSVLGGGWVSCPLISRIVT